MLLSILTGVALLNSSCAVTIKDEQFCSPIPGNLGSVCDNFLTSNPITMDEPTWIAWQLALENAGKAVECTSSDTLGDIKTELEQLCSTTPCTYPQQQAVKNAVKALDKIQKMGTHHQHLDTTFDTSEK